MNDAIDPQKAVAWLNEKWMGAKLCPICAQNNWGISEKLFELREFHGGNLVVGGPIYPVLPITCNVCGHAILFNPLVMGLVSAAQPTPAGLGKVASEPTTATPGEGSQ